MTDQDDGPDRNAALTALHDRLRAAVQELESGEQWQAWLQFASGFHRYSFNNVLLIRAQRPDATAIASYRTWQAKGRQVRKGETGLRVLAPILRRTPVVDDHGHAVRDTDGQKVVRQQVCGFRSVPVFDLAQTDGPPIPQPTRPELLAGAAPDGLWDALAAEVGERGYRLRRGSLAELDGANGLTNLTSREVWVRHDVDPAQAVKTLAHELGHILLHTNPADEPGSDSGDGRVWCRGIREVEAESVAYLVTAAHGLASDSYTFPYITTWAAGPATAERVPIADIVTRTGGRVMRAAGQLIEATLPDPIPDAGTAALAVRADRTATRRSDLREETSRSVAITVTVDERRTLLGVVADSHQFFRSRLGTSWVPGYLADRRLADALGAAPFGHAPFGHAPFGYAPAGWTTLVDHLARLGYTDTHIEAAGMASRARTGRLVDRFRDRLILPIHDQTGILVGFVGRTGPHARGDAPKYLNSPASALYTKAEVLYGLGPHTARIASGWRPVLCEGPLDAIAVDLAAAHTGTPMVGLAVSGTAFTPRHAELFRRLVGDRTICLALDGDPAGHRATEQVWRRLTDTGPRPVTVAALPNGTDPADLIAAGQASQVAELVRTAAPAHQVVCDRLLAGVDLAGNPARQLAAFRQLLPDTARIPREDKAGFVLHLAGRLDIDPAIAAVEVANRDPGLIADRITDHCQQLSRQLDQPDPDPDLTAPTAALPAPSIRRLP